MKTSLKKDSKLQKEKSNMPPKNGFKKLIKLLNGNLHLNSNTKIICSLKTSIKWNNKTGSSILNFQNIHLSGGRKNFSERNKILKKIVKLVYNSEKFKNFSIKSIVSLIKSHLKTLCQTTDKKKKNDKDIKVLKSNEIKNELVIKDIVTEVKSTNDIVKSNINNEPPQIRRSTRSIKNIGEKDKDKEKVSEIPSNNDKKDTKEVENDKPKEGASNEKTTLKPTFIDNLLSKFQISKPPTESTAFLEKLKTTTANNLNPIQNKTHLLDGDENCSNSSQSEFRGFTDNDRIANNNINILSSILDDSSCNMKCENNNKSVFESEKLDEFLKENSLENCSKIKVPVKQKFSPENKLKSDIPALLKCPNQLVKRKPVRTVAEKRQYLESRKDIKFIMAETESTVYWELKRRTKESCKLNYDIVQNVLKQDIPFRRDVWKMATWLATKTTNYRFQILNIDNNPPIKLYGGYGNYNEKYININTSKERNDALKICNPGCSVLESYPNIKFTNLMKQKIFHEKMKSKLKPKNKNLLDSYRYKIKSGPLSSKVRSQENDDIIIGCLDVFQMPKIYLELYPKSEQTFPSSIKSYLKLIQPTSSITEDWAKFACSAIQSKSEKQSSIHPFTFEIPYSDSQNKLLVRKIKDYNSRIDKKEEIKSLDKPLTFMDTIDKNDKEAVEIGNYLTDLINSASISLCQDEFIKNDPDLDYIKLENTEKITKKAKNLNNFQNKHVNMTNSKSRVLKELKRLNATFIETQTKLSEECDKEPCKMGCVCLDIRQIFPIHCRREKCMFNCTCRRETLPSRNVIVEDGLSEYEMKVLRDKATDGLAKAERDFSSTVVLTNDDTILIHNTQVDSKRTRKRSKMLKEFSDPDKAIEPVTKKIKPTLEDTKNAKISDSILNNMLHVNIPIVKLPELDDLVPWCMVHCLYKCFCKGQAISGKPFGYNEKDIPTVEIPEPPPIRMRASYTFATESNDDVNNVHDAARFIEVDAKAYKKTNNLRRPKILNTIIRKEKNSRGLQNILKQRMYQCILNNRNSKESEKNNSLDINSSLVEMKNNNNNSTEKRIIEISDEEDNGNSNDTISSIQSNSNDSRDNIQPSLNSDSLKNKTESTSAQKISRSLNNSSSVRNIPSTSSSLSSSVTNTSKPNNNLECLTSDSMFKVPVSTVGNVNSSSNNNNIVNSGFRERYKNDVSRLNMIVTKAMANICEIQKKSSKNILDPKSKCLSNLRWEYLVQAYTENLAFVWEVQYIVNGKVKLMIVLMKKNIKPQFPNMIYARNIKTAAYSGLCVLCKLLKKCVINERTKNLAVLLFGHVKFWSIIGFIHSHTDYIENGIFVRPTPSTHPKLAKKINRLHTCLTEKFLIKEVPNKTTDEVCNNLPPVAKTITLKTNIEIESISLNISTSISVPLPIIKEHRWFMLVMRGDFSDIYIPTWKSFLKYERIKATYEIAKKSQKTVRILCNKKSDVKPDVYVTPNENDKIFFGPFKPNEALNIILYQELDGNMLIREDYEQQLNITRTERTKGCWLYMKGSNNTTTLLSQQQENESNLSNDSNIKSGSSLLKKQHPNPKFNLDKSTTKLIISTPYTLNTGSSANLKTSSNSDNNTDSISKTLTKPSMSTLKISNVRSISPIPGCSKDLTYIEKSKGLIRLQPGSSTITSKFVITEIDNSKLIESRKIMNEDDKPSFQIDKSNSMQSKIVENKLKQPPIILNKIIASKSKSPRNDENLNIIEKVKTYSRSVVEKNNKSEIDFKNPPIPPLKSLLPKDIKTNIKFIPPPPLPRLTKISPSPQSSNTNINNKPCASIGKRRNTMFDIKNNTNPVEIKKVRRSFDDNSEQLNNVPITFLKNTELSILPPKKNILNDQTFKLKTENDTVVITKLNNRTKSTEENIKNDGNNMNDIKKENVECVNNTTEINSELNNSNDTQKDILDAINKISGSTTISRINCKKEKLNESSEVSIEKKTTPKKQQQSGICIQNNKTVTEPIVLSDDEEDSVIISTMGGTPDFSTFTTFLVSNIKNLGKIPCAISNNRIKAYMPRRVLINMRYNMDHVNKYLRKYIKNILYYFIPKDIELKWELSQNPAIYDTYDIMDDETLDPNMVLTEYGILDLRDNFETDEMMKINSKLVTNLILLKIAKEHLHITEFSASNLPQIIEKIEEHIKKLENITKALTRRKEILKNNIFDKRTKLKLLKEQIRPQNKSENEKKGLTLPTEEENAQTIVIEDD